MLRYKSLPQEVRDDLSLTAMKRAGVAESERTAARNG